MRSRSRRLLVLLAIAVGAAAALVPVPSLSLPRGMEIHVDAVAVQRTVAEGAGAARAHALRTGVSTFRMIALSWSGAEAGSARVRVHTAHGWSGWTTVDTDGAEGPDHGSREWHPGTRTDPYWAGKADGYELDLSPDVRDVHVHLARETGPRLKLSTTTPSASASVPMPPINTRAAWGARAPKAAPEYGSSVQMTFVHHTVNANDYAQSDVPSILRAIQAFHMDSNGWNDIGYNFLVDRFGGMWEGRAGGMDRPVIGAHTLGFNTNSAGVAVMGDFTSTPASGPAIDSTGRIIAWKLGLTNTDPMGTAVLTSGDSGSRWAAGTPVRFNNVSGHRDANYTDCPGDGLYGQLGDVRNAARAYWAPILAYDAGFRGGVYVSGAELTGDNRGEVITGAGQGGGPHLRWFYGTGQAIGGWFAYPSGFSGGVRVGRLRPALASKDDIISAPGPSGGPQIRTFHPDGTPVSSFLAYSSGWLGGVFVAGGNLDTVPGGDIVTGADKGGGPQVRIFHQDGTPIGGFFPYASSFPGGVRVATGDVNGDGVDEIITGAGPGGGPHVRIFRADGTPIGGFFAYASNFTGGVYVGSVRSPDNKTDWIVTGAGEGGGTHVRVFKLDGTEVGGFFASNDTNGVRVSGGNFDNTLPGQIVLAEGPGTVPAVSFRRTNGAVFFP